MKEQPDESQFRGLQRLIGKTVNLARKRVGLELPVPDLGTVFRRARHALPETHLKMIS
jgi:hypothetical protein